MPEGDDVRDQPAYVFKDGRLLVFLDTGVLSIRGAPVPRAAGKPDGAGGWEPVRPTFKLVRPYRPRKAAQRKPLVRGGGDPTQLQFGDLLAACPQVAPAAKPRKLTPAQRRKRAFDQFRFSLPKPHAAVMEKFPSRQWDLLLFLHRQGRFAEELAGARPVVAYLLGIHSENRRLPVREVRHLTGMKGRELVGELGFPGSKAMVKVLEKVHPQTFSEREAVRLRRVVAREPDLVQRLGHLSEVHAGVLALLADPCCAARVSDALLHRVAEERRERYSRSIARLVRDVVVLEELMGVDSKPAQFRDVAGLRRAHESLLVLRRQRDREVQRALAEQNRARGPVRFPPPPLPGTASIIPVTTAGGLVREGREQDNCVATYVEDVVAGISYIYKVTEPERCTLEIARDDDGNWVCEQLERSSNRQAGRETAKAVERWLGRYRIGL